MWWDMSSSPVSAAGCHTGRRGGCCGEGGGWAPLQLPASTAQQASKPYAILCHADTHSAYTTVHEALQFRCAAV